MSEIETPMLDKMRGVHDDSETVGAFLEWLQGEQRLHLLCWSTVEEEDECPGASLRERCYGGKTQERYRQIGNEGRYEPDPKSPTCRRCNGTGRVTRSRETWVPDGRTIEQLLAAYFGIDLQQVAEEKQAVYEAMAARAGQARQGNGR